MNKKGNLKETDYVEDENLKGKQNQNLRKLRKFMGKKKIQKNKTKTSQKFKLYVTNEKNSIKGMGDKTEELSQEVESKNRQKIKDKGKKMRKRVLRVHLTRKRKQRGR